MDFDINTGDDLIKAFAILVRDKVVTADDLRDELMRILDGNKKAVDFVLEKISIQVECMNLGVFSGNVMLS